MKTILASLAAIVALGVFSQPAQARDYDDHGVVIVHEHSRDHAPYWRFHKHYVWVEGHREFRYHRMVWIPGHYEVERW